MNNSVEATNGLMPVIYDERTNIITKSNSSFIYDYKLGKKVLLANGERLIYNLDSDVFSSEIIIAIDILFSGVYEKQSANK